MNRRQRGALVVFMWAGVFLSMPFTTLVLLDHGAGGAPGGGLLPSWLFLVGMLLLNVLLFISAMLCSKMNTDMSDFEKSRPKIDEGQGGGEDSLMKYWEEMNDEQQYGIRLLRMAPGSPLRGVMMERAIIRSINGLTPSTAAEANTLLTHGENEIEWQDSRGRIQTSELIVRNNDLMAQFEQVNRPVLAQKSETQDGETQNSKA